MNRTALLLLITSTLVLVTGHTIEVSGPIEESNGRLVFRSTGGTLYSIAADEVDEVATKQLKEERLKAETSAPLKLKVTPEERDRLLEELQKNHAGEDPEPQRLLSALPPISSEQRAAENQDEWSWRREARALEEAVLQAEEALQLLLDREAQLQSEITGFISLGYRPIQFSYQTTMLAAVREQIPAARLAVTQAMRALEQFKEDARRQGIMPGWLR
jgi:hypothetical protein